MRYWHRVWVYVGWCWVGWTKQWKEVNSGNIKVPREHPNRNGPGEEDSMDGISSRVITRLDKWLKVGLRCFLPLIVKIVLSSRDCRVAFTHACFHFIVITACGTSIELQTAHRENTKSFGLLGSLKQPNIKKKLITIFLTHLTLFHSLCS